MEPTQGGMLRDTDEINRMLPLGLRAEMAPETKSEERYDKLWGALRTWGSPALREFFDAHNDELEAFAAEFEPMVGQIGAFVFFGGALVGFDVLPSSEAWLHWWRLIIRDCYGAEYLSMRLESRDVAPKVDWPSFAGEPEDTMIRYQEWLVKETNALVQKTAAAVLTGGDGMTTEKITGTGLEYYTETAQSLIADVVTLDGKPAYVGAAIR